MQFDLSIQPIRTWTRHGAAAFCRTRDQWGEHSNMAAGFDFEAHGHWMRGSETLYQILRFPDAPQHQLDIIGAPTLMEGKKVAYQKIGLTRPDWEGEVQLHAMAYALTLKRDATDYGRLLAASGARDIIEISTRDDFWGAKPYGDVLVGRNMLGWLEMQLRAGATMAQPPAGSRFPAPAVPAQASFFAAPESKPLRFARRGS